MCCSPWVAKSQTQLSDFDFHFDMSSHLRLFTFGLILSTYLPLCIFSIPWPVLNAGDTGVRQTLSLPVVFILLSSVH